MAEVTQFFCFDPLTLECASFVQDLYNTESKFRMNVNREDDFGALPSDTIVIRVTGSEEVAVILKLKYGNRIIEKQIDDSVADMIKQYNQMVSIKKSRVEDSYILKVLKNRAYGKSNFYIDNNFDKSIFKE